MRSSLLALAALLGFGAACDFQKTSNQLQAEDMMVATVLGTPPVDLSAAVLAGLDAGLPADAGFTADAGTVTVPPQTVAFVFFGQRTDTTLSQPPTPITDATVSLSQQGGSQFSLAGDGQGNYTKTSAEDPNLQYQSGATYDFTSVEQGSTYVGEVQDAPQVEQIAEFHPAQGYISLPAGSSFTFTRPPPPAGEARNIGFVTVFPVDNNGNRGNPTFTNVPQTPLGFLQLIAAPSQWKQDTVTIDGSAFPQSQQNYAIVFQSVKNGGPQSDNLFTGSAILAGTADVGVVRTQ